jgi:signal recognition particle GTPase
VAGRYFSMLHFLKPNYSSIQKIQQKIMNNPALTIIAGVNGSRKTTFALD